MSKIPHRLYLTEDQMPQQWFNLRAAMKEQPDPMLNPGTLQPMTEQDLYPIFCEELAHQEMDAVTEYVDIPEEIQNVYKMYRPSPLIRAYELEKALKTPAKIYYKFEGNNTSGSHKLNSAVAQAYYAKKQGLTGVTTETGAGQWGTALSEACSYFGLSCDVFMVKCSYEQKPFRKAVMNVFDASIAPSPSELTEVGRKILAENPGTSGSLGCAISEAVEAAVKSGGTKRYVLGSVLNQVLLHQSIIGLESKIAMEQPVHPRLFPIKARVHAVAVPVVAAVTHSCAEPLQLLHTAVVPRNAYVCVVSGMGDPEWDVPHAGKVGQSG